jgi:hypothetical protein
MSNEDLNKLDEGLAYVYSVIGDDTILSAAEIKEALWHYFFDTEETIEWALGKDTYMKREIIFVLTVCLYRQNREGSGSTRKEKSQRRGQER